MALLYILIASAHNILFSVHNLVALIPIQNLEFWAVILVVLVTSIFTKVVFAV